MDGPRFIINGAAPPRDLALLTADSELRLPNNVGLIGRFDGEFASRSQTYTGTVKLRYQW